ncbi:hypothetical protein Ciccas_012169 [Cichlidogyrus casuarinus]|uniref:EF-hand domain-containing protein n=1 Tax=Cichlidogyrus casuarinus TaxID=1844966 RepID=A0ABD2PP54_9PLAT
MNSDYVKQQFLKFDTDFDGKLDKEEAIAAANEVGINRSDAKNIVNHLLEQLPENEIIPMDEFIEDVKAFCVSKLRKDPFKLMFHRLDRDGDGFLDFDEVRMAISAFGHLAKDGKVRDLFNMADSNNDGMIDVEEYMEFLKKLHSKQLLFNLISDKAKNGFPPSSSVGCNLKNKVYV